MVERHTRLTQNQLPKGMWVRIPPPRQLGSNRRGLCYAGGVGVRDEREGNDMETGLVITQDRRVRTIEWEAGAALKPLQGVVGGYVEAVALGDGLTMWVNEDGLFREDLITNKLATVLINRRVGELVLVVGDVVITRDGAYGETVGLTEQDVADVTDEIKGWVRG